MARERTLGLVLSHECSVVITCRREYNSYILAKLVDDINKILLETSGISVTRLPNGDLPLAASFPGD